MRAVRPDGPGPVRRQRSLEIVAANDIAGIDELVYLLNHDSVHRWDGPRAQTSEGGIQFGPFHVKLSAEREPGKIPWGDRGVDVVLECTGRFTKRPQMEPHLQGPSAPSHVVLSAPGDVDQTVCVGVNEESLDRSAHRLVSCASCTTNALAPVLMVLDRAFGIRWGLLGTVHAYTAGQGLVDVVSGKDFRRGRAAAVNIVPTSTGAGKAMSLVLPNLAGKLDASAVRVPVANGSFYEATCTLDGSPELPRVLEALRDAAAQPSLQGVLDVRQEPLVSSDIIDDQHSSIVDVDACVAQGPLVKIAGWYDNEAAYAQRILDLSVLLGTK